MKQEINEHTVNQLLRHLTDDEYVALVKNFIDDTRALMQEISPKAFVQNKLKVIRIVHTIKGNAISLGFDRLHDLSAQMEANLKHMTLNENSTIFMNYIEETIKILNKVTEYNDIDDRSEL